MSTTIPAVFESGVFRPLESVQLPEGTQAEVIVRPQTAPSTAESSELPSTWPAGYFEQTAGALAGQQFERPPQGELPMREEW